MRDSDVAYEKIKEMIIKTEIKPGSVISKNKLMKQLGIGSTPIREALNRLSWDGLVQIIPRRGMFVSDLRFEDIQSIFEMRYELEGLAGRLAAERITDEQLKRIEELIKDGHNSKTGFEREVEVDREFHLLIAEATGNRFLQEELKRIYNFSLRLLYYRKSKMASLEESKLQYFNVLKALKNRDGKTASNILKEHVADFRRKLLGGSLSF